MTKRCVLLFALLLLLSMAAFGQAACAWNGAEPPKPVADVTLKDSTISLNASSKIIKKGATFTIKSLITPKTTGKYVKYQSSNTSIAKVTQAGKVKGVGYGDVVITANYGDDVATCKVTVTGPLQKIALNAKSASCETGQTVELRIASQTPFNADVSSAKWTSSNPSVCQVTGGIVTAVGVGKSTITCKVGSKKASCTVSVAAPAGSSSGYSDAPTPQAESGSGPNSSLEAQILQLVNQERSRVGLKRLSYYNPLEGYAQVRAREIVSKFAHTRPNGSSCFSAIKYSYSYGGENIAMGFDSAQDVMDAWMNSPGHRANILNANYTELGVGIHRTENCVFWVQLFTRKR